MTAAHQSVFLLNELAAACKASYTLTSQRYNGDVITVRTPALENWVAASMSIDKMLYNYVWRNRIGYTISETLSF